MPMLPNFSLCAGDDCYQIKLRVYYTLAVWWFKPFLSVGLWVHSHLSGGLHSRNYWRFRS